MGSWAQLLDHIRLVLRGDALERAAQELLDGQRTDADLRRALIVHPRAAPDGTGLAPGIQVALEVLRPGEQPRHQR